MKARMPGEGRSDLAPDELRWIQSKWSEIRKAHQLADESNTTWKRINEEIKDKFAREDAARRAAGRFPLTDLMKAQAKADSLPLKDALAIGNWHSRNAERHMQDVLLFLKMKEMGLV